jgi:hypothetical protein
MVGRYVIDLLDIGLTTVVKSTDVRRLGQTRQIMAYIIHPKPTAMASSRRSVAISARELYPTGILESYYRVAFGRNDP